MSESRTELESKLLSVSSLLAERLRQSTEYERSATEVADALLSQVDGYAEDAISNGLNYLTGRLAICGLCCELKVMLEIEYETRGI